jgi:hypothetical protein
MPVPAASGTTMETTRDGYSCAPRLLAASVTAKAVANADARKRDARFSFIEAGSLDGFFDNQP